MKLSILKLLLPTILLLLPCVFQCQANPNTYTKPIPRGNRSLAIDLNTPKEKDYDFAFGLAKNIGVQDVGLFFNWNDIEKKKCHYDSKFLEIANSYYPPRHTSVALTIAPIHTNRLMVPADLKDYALDDPVVVSRFKKLLDYIFLQTPNLEISALIIGSEFEAYLGSDQDKWKQYKSFLEQVTKYSHTKRPEVKIAYEAQFYSLTTSSKKQLQDLNKSADIVGVSYYPLNADFTVKAPTSVDSDFAQIVKLYPNKPIYFFQFGYPSSKYLKSSQHKQKLFIEHAFRAWDRFPQQIKLIDFTWLHDRDPNTLKETAKFYGIGGKAFKEFIGSLGLRTYTGSGKDKSAFQALRKEAKKRGW